MPRPPAQQRSKAVVALETTDREAPTSSAGHRRWASSPASLGQVAAFDFNSGSTEERRGSSYMGIESSSAAAPMAAHGVRSVRSFEPGSGPTSAASDAAAGAPTSLHHQQHRERAQTALPYLLKPLPPPVAEGRLDEHPSTSSAPLHVGLRVSAVMCYKIMHADEEAVDDEQESEGGLSFGSDLGFIRASYERLFVWGGPSAPANIALELLLPQNKAT